MVGDVDCDVLAYQIHVKLRTKATYVDEIER